MDQPKNHRRIIANVKAICASVMKKFPIMASLGNDDAKGS